MKRSMLPPLLTMALATSCLSSRSNAQSLEGDWGSEGYGESTAPPLEQWVEPLTSMELVRIQPGEFIMGSLPNEPARETQEREHRVALTEPFYLGRFEVTQEQWQIVMGSRPSHFADCGADCPVENISYDDIRDFLDRLRRLTGKTFRLPTEAEWEYACRAGTGAVFGLADTLSSEDANFDGRDPYPGAAAGPYRARPTPVGTFRANAWGLHDMNGNVWEWCEDKHCPYPEDAVEDPRGDCASALQVIRGGSWYFGADSARCGLRYTHRPMDLGPSLGLRLALDAP